VQWKVIPRGVIDDVEANYDSEYTNNNPHPFFPNFPRDPKAQRIRRREEKWKWFFSQLADKPKIDDILKEAEKHFRNVNNIAMGTTLNRTQRRQLKQFTDKMCNVIGEVHEIGSFIIHGTAAAQLLQGELDSLNIFGPRIDSYLLPLLKALVSIINPKLPPVLIRTP